jgi:pseudo-rSAM protein
LPKAKQNYWLYLEPYVHLSIKKEHVLLYNTLSGQMLEYGQKEPEVVKLIKKLSHKKNLYVIPVNQRQIECIPGLQRFITDLRDYFMGDVLDATSVSGKPIQLTPILNIHKDVKKIKGDLSRSAGEEMMSYVTRLTLYVNSDCQHHCNRCSLLYKQFDHCYKSTGSKKELNLSNIKNMLWELKGSALSAVKILGGNIFNYSQLKELVAFLDTLPQLKTYYFHYLQLEREGKKLKILQGQRNSINVMVPLPVQKSHFEKVWKEIIDSGIKAKAIFIIQQEDDIEIIQNLAESFEIEHFILRPFYNGSNLSFFEKYVFVNREMIQKIKPGEKDIFSKMVLNSTNFGNMVVLSNCNIYANVNAAPLGKLGKDSLYNAIYKEMVNGKSWRRTRKKVTPCKHCTFEVLCPPLSNYEYAIGKNNLCHIRKSDS